MKDIQTNIPDSQLEQIGSKITDGVSQIIDQAKHTVAVYLNSEVTMTYWRVGKYIAGELDAIGDEKYGSKIVATVSQQLVAKFGKGYTRTAVARISLSSNVRKRYLLTQLITTLICCSITVN